MLRHKTTSTIPIYIRWLSTLKTSVCRKWGWHNLICVLDFPRRMQKSDWWFKKKWLLRSELAATKNYRQFLSLCHFSLFLTASVPIIAAWIFIAARTLQWCSDMIFTAPGKLAGLLWPYYDHAPHFHFQLNFSSLHWLKHFLGMHFLFLQGKLHSIVLVTDQSEFSLNITRNIMEGPFVTS